VQYQSRDFIESRQKVKAWHPEFHDHSLPHNDRDPIHYPPTSTISTLYNGICLEISRPHVRVLFYLPIDLTTIHPQLSPMERRLTKDLLISYNKYLSVAARVARRSLKEENRLQAERRGEMELRFAKWTVGVLLPQMCIIVDGDDFER